LTPIDTTRGLRFAAGLIEASVGLPIEYCTPTCRPLKFAEAKSIASRASGEA